ncbi:MAG: peptide deformylase [Bacteroidales bacterium]|jgi:peptide deformylase|nr:peptide deformylase [Bacteroidales bacterium]MBQ5783729.1 peptide deformylase [Bacteroidales bacterium]
MILPIYIYGTDVLRAVAEPIDVNTYPNLQELIDNMQETMESADGVGIAAPQVGKSIQLLIVDGAPFGEDDPELAAFRRVMINPQVLEESQETAEYNEGCLSVPNIHADITRPAKIKVKYLDREGKEIVEEFGGFACRMVQHEMDHLIGKMFVDRATPIRKKMISAKLNNIANGKVHPHYKCVKKLIKKK